MKYSAKDVEDAALLCAVKSASKMARASCFLDDIVDSVLASAGGSKAAQDLACGAFSFVFCHPNTAEMSFGIGWAEAESLLRSGWLPPGSRRGKGVGR